MVTLDLDFTDYLFGLKVFSIFVTCSLYMYDLKFFLWFVRYLTQFLLEQFCFYYS